jgi:hypothetical protein
LASTRQLPSPRSSASKILTRKSSEYARPILVIAVTSPEKPRITHRIVDGYRYLDSALDSFNCKGKAGYSPAFFAARLSSCRLPVEEAKVGSVC